MKRLRVRDRGRHNGRVEQETRFATMAANRTIIPKRLIHGKRAHRRRLSFLHTENLQAQLVKAAHQAHEAIVNGTITTP